MSAVLDSTRERSGDQLASSGVPPLRDVAPVPFHRLLRVELRKMVDTRAGRWMLIVMASISLLIVTGLVIWGTASELSFGLFLSLTSLPLIILLPIVGVMAATSEWSQRTGLVTFTLEPRRMRVVAAKVGAGIILGLIVIASAFAASAIGELLVVTLRGVEANWEVPAGVVYGFIAAMVLYVVQGLAFGFSFLNTPLAIVASVLLPTLWSVVSGFNQTLTKIAGWLDLNRTLEPLLSGKMTGESWAHVGTSAAVWILLPLAFGAWRVATREVK